MMVVVGCGCRGTRHRMGLVATKGWPFGSGPLSWLIEACGGEDLDYGA